MKGILFKPDMIKAIREGRKTQTRRVIKASNSTVCGYCYKSSEPIWAGLVWDNRVFVDCGPHILHPYTSQYLHVPYTEPDNDDDGRVFRVRSLLEVGDVVYIKEAWGLSINEHGHECLCYKSTNDDDMALDNPQMMRLWNHETKKWILKQTECPSWYPDKWFSPLSMPAWAARDFIQITDVRVQRVQEITPVDCLAEGIMPNDMPAKALIDDYACLWDSINKKYPWSSNPWVWVYTSKKVDKGNSSDV